MKSSFISQAVFNNYGIINCRGSLVDLTSPKVMGIMNITPDSFFDGGKFTEEKAMLDRVEKMLDEGAVFIDVGAHSTRPGAEVLPADTEEKRLLPAIKAIVKSFPDVFISVDTFRAGIAEKCIDLGAAIINDVSAGTIDKKMFETVARLNVPYVLMHMQGTPETMQQEPHYEDVVGDVTTFLAEKASFLKSLGVSDVLVDPGFGFGKSQEHNFELLKYLTALQVIGCPVLAGLSRKSMICKTLKVNPDKALNGTTALNMTALMNGASILRVHDVKEAVEVVKLFEKMM